ncbi:hypothetical protein [Nostoc sp.]|uniref:hypothetical protein n=1 Tax=Nostoc sp. TaxID=1180 RepID=UPI002FFADB2F
MNCNISVLFQLSELQLIKTKKSLPLVYLPTRQKKQGEELLASTYGCNKSQVLELMQQARIEPIAQWCAPKER